MKDRISLNPGRVRLTPVAGETDLFDMEMADNPTELGTALNKANLLTDATAAAIAAAFGSTPDTPNEALALLAGSINMEIQTYVGTGVYGSWANANSLTFEHEPKIVFIYNTMANVLVGVDTWQAVLFWDRVKAAFTAYPNDCAFNVLYNSNKRNRYRLSNNNKTIEWYTTEGAAYNPTESQLNATTWNYAVISFY